MTKISRFIGEVVPVAQRVALLHASRMQRRTFLSIVGVGLSVPVVGAPMPLSVQERVNRRPLDGIPLEKAISNHSIRIPYRLR